MIKTFIALLKHQLCFGTEKGSSHGAELPFFLPAGKARKYNKMKDRGNKNGENF